MKVFDYQGLSQANEKQVGRIEADSRDGAIVTLQHRGILITTINEVKVGGMGSLGGLSAIFNKVPTKDVVFASRQISTLFEAHVSAYKAFSLLEDQTENKILKAQIHGITGDLTAGLSISQAMSKYPDTFSPFFLNMVRSGEESGKLSEVFVFLADYLERQYQLTAKVKSAMIYPAFVISVFFIIMILMMTVIIPKIGGIITDSGAPIPFFTKIVLGVSSFIIHFGIILLVLIIAGIAILVLYLRTANGKIFMDHLKLKLPIFKKMFQKVYLARISDNLDTMLTSGIPIIRTLEVTSAVVGNVVYENIVKDVSEQVKTGIPLSTAFAKHAEVPPLLSQMIRVGEETGMLGQVLKVLGKFYAREVNQAIDTMISLIEPMMIVILGGGVGLLIVSVLVPIFNLASNIQ